MEIVFEIARDLFGTEQDPKDLTTLQVCARALAVFISLLFMVRVANKRFLGKHTAFDFILALLLASILGRAINGSATLLPSIASALVLVILHRVLAFLAARTSAFGGIVKGHSDVLIRDGAVVSEALKRHNLSHADLVEELRLNGGIESPEQVRKAVLERNGEISVLRDGRVP